MGVFHYEEPPNPPRKFKFFSAILKDAISNCGTCGGKLSTSTSSPEEEHPTSDVDDEQEVVVSAIRSGAMEKLRHKPFDITESFSWVFSPKTGELFVAPKIVKLKEDGDDEEGEKEEYLSVGSCFSCCSSALSREPFFSVKTNFSRCPSFKELEFPDFEFQDSRRRSILQEFCHCEGWPFGLCRKAVLLPPLPKSPSESWSWHKGTGIIKMAQLSYPSSFSGYGSKVYKSENKD